MQGEPQTPGPKTDSQKPPAPDSVEPKTNDGSTDTSLQPASGDAILRVHLPEDSIVYVNGKRTQTKGTLRNYVSRQLSNGRLYPYEVKAVVVRNGQTLAQTKLVDLTAGEERSIDFDFAADAPVLTSLSLSVPADATVKLGGTETTTVGAFRYYSTKSLSGGEVWRNYKIEVSVNRDGRQLTRTKVVDLKAGESLDLSFDFDKMSVAAN